MDTTTNWKTPVYFDLEAVETIAEEEATVTLNYTAPVMFPDEAEFVFGQETETPISSGAPVMAINPIPRPRLYPGASPWLWLTSALGLFLVFLLIADAYHFVVRQYDSSFFVGTLFLSLLLAIVYSVSILTYRAYQNLQALRNVTALQQEGRVLMETNGYGNALHYVNKIAHFYLYRPDIRTRLERFYSTMNDTHHDREVCLLFSTRVLKEIDQQAYRIVVQRSKETALLVMISQVALLDTVLTLWRNVRMIRDIATLYGGRPGLLASFGLVTAVLQNLIYADVSEILADTVAESFGNSMLAVFSAQAAQGLGSGIFTARVGLKAMQACRPLPFLEDEKPKLKDVRWEVISSLKKMFETKPKSKKSV